MAFEEDDEEEEEHELSLPFDAFRSASCFALPCFTDSFEPNSVSGVKPSSGMGKGREEKRVRMEGHLKEMD